MKSGIDPKRKSEYNRKQRMKQANIVTSLNLTNAALKQEIKKLKKETSKMVVKNKKQERQIEEIQTNFKLYKLYHGKCVYDRSRKEVEDLIKVSENQLETWSNQLRIRTV